MAEVIAYGFSANRISACVLLDTLRLQWGPAA